MPPSSSGSVRFLWSLLAKRPGLLTLATVSGALWMLPTALLPLVIGQAIDAGIRDGDGGTLLRWVLVVLGLGLTQMVAAGALQWAAHTLWLHGATSAQRIVLGHVVGLGGVLARKVRVGEVVAVGASDIYRIGSLLEVIGRATGSLVSFAVAAIVVLWISPIMGVIVLIGVPLATGGIGPLLRPLRRREETQRERLGQVSAQAADIVSGLRILRGIGGETRFHARFVDASQRVREAGVAAGRIEAWLAGAEILLPGLVTVLVTWLGARLALDGTISVGELVAFYGVSAFLVIPVRTATEASYAFASAMVAAGRARALLRLEPEPAPPEHPKPLPPGPLGLFDEATGLRIPAGQLTVIDAGEQAEALAERLAAESIAGDVPLRDVGPDELHRRIVLAHNQDLLFSGPARAELDLESEVDLESALHAADAHEVMSALPVDGQLDERARSLSGGQRQRLLLARALCSDADVLILDEPTSAVDAHTEARIAQRVSEFRRGRTTVVLSQSPLWTAVADRVLDAGAKT
ncbi:ABC transporter transmembrane domain-containing protein [Saccharopolyspora phatthalungensis]|uniref:ABC-type multidrug transport system fused ATPase/permease subunit n=1 Tax=Saccharopolyspora phatthalungensis TaxID=664693 RepID=A0A840PW49_9PSEU|nr:ABC transporter ATP-binding protein [Saccharopolyspora phatthalungensis]MBB5154502.1 ABC-type multidrug transport system fused ATPase/permease subunit [Saccharopolyspora phatthalungensis]